MTDHSQNSNCPVCGQAGVAHSENTDQMYQGNTIYYYHQCGSCKAIYQHPSPSPDVIASYYPDNYSIYQQPSISTKKDTIGRSILKKYAGYSHLSTTSFCDFISPYYFFFKPEKPFKYIENGKALDIGCGNGKLLLQLQELGWDVQGVEFNQIAADICRKNDLTIFQGEVHEADFPDNYFDFINAQHLLEHLPNPKLFFNEVSRILKPGGELLLRTPNTNSLGRSWFGKYWFPDEIPRHLVLFNPENLSQLAGKYGFNSTCVTTLVKTKHILKSLDYVIDNRGKPSKKRKLRKWIAKLYYPVARLTGRGDEIYALFRKP